MPDPAKRTLIASVPTWTNSREWFKFPQQASAPIPLVAGSMVYIEVLHKEGTGGDNLAVAWQLAGGAGQTIIPGAQLSPIEPLPPVAVDDAASVPPGGIVLIPVLANDFDPNGPANFFPASVQILTPPAHGSVEVVGSGPSVRYTHHGDGSMADSFAYRVCDSGGLCSATAVVHVVVSDAVRLENGLVSLPASLPSTSHRLENAFPGLTFSQPLAITSPPGEANRLFIVEKGGRIAVIPDLQNPTVSTFLTRTVSTTGEQGLLGMAFHPNYAQNGFFYVFYTTTGTRYDRISRYSVSATNPNAADPASELVLIQQLDEASNHNGGDMHFGPDGYLYVSLGDEGGGNDQYNNAQLINKDFFAGVIRIDVDRLPGNLEPNDHPAVMRDAGVARYKVPVDNPWVGATSFNGATVDPAEVITEFYAVGLRNPWRMSFDRLTGDLWLADVGQGAREEINKIRHGGNYGWAFREGFIAGPKPAPPGVVADDPVWDYGRTEGTSVTGGVVYRGSRFPGLFGAYIFSDYNTGNIWALREGQGGGVTVERIAGEAGIAGFGTDPSNGDVLLADLGDGVIHRLLVDEDPAQPAVYPPTLTDTGAFADTASLTPNPGVIPYDINLPFWSDHAHKSRWFALPNATNTIAFAVNDPWTFPAGTVFVKHFDLETTRGNPASARRLETRFLVLTGASAYGLSYRWNEEQTEAFLVPAAGTNLVVQVEEDGLLSPQNWAIPSRTECMVCHTAASGFALSFNTRQLNRTATTWGVATNQLAALSAAGYLVPPPDVPDMLPFHAQPDDTAQSLTFRARSYLAVNCAGCHQPNSGTQTSFDLRPHRSLDQTALLSAPLNNNGGNPANRLIVPGQPANSVLLSRLTACCGFSRMPPLASSIVDTQGAALIHDWILHEVPTYQSYTEWATHAFGDPSLPIAAKHAHADADPADNYLEYLTGTSPLDPQDFWAPTGKWSEDNVVLSFVRAPNTGMQVEWSPNMADWQPWNVTQNRIRISSTNVYEQISGPAPPANPGYFRVRLWEP
jgi:uncharacterized repeat protein (TIGR03806 family)